MNSTGDPFSVNIPLTAPVPAFFIAVALVAGTLGCFTAGIVVALTAVGVLMAAAVLFRSKTAILLTIAALIGALNVQIHRVEVPAAIEYGQEQKFVGSIDEVTERDYGTFLTVTLDSIDGVLAAPRAKAAVTLLPDSSMLLNLSAGELIQFRGVASAPGSRLLLPDERNYDAENIRQGIAVSILSSDKRVTLRGDASGLMNAFRRLRTHFVEAILGADFSTGTATFLAACLAGDDSMVSPITRETFSITGLAHLLALSGTHVAIITLLFSLILIPLRAFGRRRLRAWLLIAALWFFALLTGLSPSVVRAVTMATVMLLARILERSVSPFQSLSVAAILIIIFDPNTVLSIGFQISFAAVWGIVAVNKLLQRPRYLRLPLYIRLITGYLTVTISATIATTPLVAYYFHNLPLWFIPTNIVAAFILPILLAVALPCILFSSATAGTFLPRMADTLYNLIASTSEQFASLSNPTVTSLYPPTWVVAMFYLAMIAGTILAIKHYRPRFVISSMIASMTFCLILVVALRPTTPRSEWFLHGIFTGTALVVTEDGVAWLVDDCPTDIVTRRLINRLEPRLADFLGRRGIDTLTVMPRRYTSKLIDRDGNSIVVGNKSFLFVDNNSVSPNEQGQQIDYLIITRGVTQNAAAIATRFKPRQVIMTASLNALISRRLEAELKDAGIEPVSLRDSIIHSSNAPFASNSR